MSEWAVKGYHAITGMTPVACKDEEEAYSVAHYMLFTEQYNRAEIYTRDYVRAPYKIFDTIAAD